MLLNLFSVPCDDCIQRLSISLKISIFVLLLILKLWPRAYKTLSCLTQLSMKFVLLINLKLLTVANSSLLNIAEHENLSAHKYENANYFIFISVENSILN